MNIICKILLLLIFPSALFSQTQNNPLEGQWKVVFPNYQKEMYEYFDNGNFNVITFNKTGREFGLASIGSTGKYSVSFSGDTCVEFRTLDYSTTHYFRFDGDYAVSFSYKPIKQTSTLIHDYSLWVRNIPNPERKGTIICRKIRYIVPKGFSGIVAIEYGKPDGVEPEHDQDGNVMLCVPQSGILKTTISPNVFCIALGEYQVELDNGDGDYIQLEDLSSLADKNITLDSTLYPINKLVSRVYGFNPVRRKELNDMYKDNFSGNVILIGVGKFDIIRNNLSNLFR